MSATLTCAPVVAPPKKIAAVPSGPLAAPQLGSDLERLRTEEQARIDRLHQEAVASVQRRAYFD